MKTSWFLVLLLAGNCALAQTSSSKTSARIRTLTTQEGAVTEIHLSPGYTTSIRLPEEVSSVVVGSPSTFKAEHSESEPKLVFIKPISAKPVESNALITTKSGQEISLHLISAGQAAPHSDVDFLLEYHRPRSMFVTPDADPVLFVSQVKAISSNEQPSRPAEKNDPLLLALERQEKIAAPGWQGKKFAGAIGESSQVEQQTVLAFSVFNNFSHAIELLPPQITLSGKAINGKKKQIESEPIAIRDYRITRRRLEPGERADGVLVFERPGFKESSENLELQLAEADQVDHPLRLPVSFTATISGGSQ